jgi:hypothetical protein
LALLAFQVLLLAFLEELEVVDPILVGHNLLVDHMGQVHNYLEEDILVVVDNHVVDNYLEEDILVEVDNFLVEDILVVVDNFLEVDNYLVVDNFLEVDSFLVVDNFLVVVHNYF